MIDEYFIETAPEKQWQMWLNQWRHTYKIEILAAVRGPKCDSGGDIGKEQLTLVIKRSKLL